MKRGDCRCGHMPGDHAWMSTGACEECACDSFRRNRMSRETARELIKALLVLGCLGFLFSMWAFDTAPAWAYPVVVAGYVALWEFLNALLDANPPAE